MNEEKSQCDKCGCTVDPDTGKCPSCDQTAPSWMVWLVYALVGLFLVGLIYRLIWP